MDNPARGRLAHIGNVDRPSDAAFLVGLGHDDARIRNLAARLDIEARFRKQDFDIVIGIDFVEELSAVV